MFLIVLVVCALALGVVTRYSGYTSFATPTARSISPADAQNSRPHMDRDAFIWRVSLSPGIFVEHPKSASVVLPAAPEVTNHSYNRELYNRPPPSGFYS